MFSRVLIANRGEIACRIIRACRSLGLNTVAVCSEADALSLHAQQADQSVVIGPAAPRDSYLDIERLLAAARDTGAEAVHPGYGFLAENAGFARAVVEAGLTWIGPDAQTIADMGNKNKARSLAAAAGVPVVPGSSAVGVSDLAAMAAAADSVGYPLLIKAAAGGGGIGMQRVDSSGTLSAAAVRTRDLAKRYFGDGAVYLERLVPVARHVEVQVLGDGTGHAVHLFERDCSMQRRFQKIIEESPAPALSPATRAGMLESAVRLAAAQRYKGPGTVEFIVDAGTQEYFFLEMNTRIQVEHPVTEMVTGLDIVALQLRIANGEPLSMAQADVALEGHALECRLYAEDPKAGFRPSTGTLRRLVLPNPSSSVRIDTGYREGDTITPYYDPMIAKLIVHAPSRGAALSLMARSLAFTQIEGVKTNLGFLRRAVAHPKFASAEVHTRFAEAAPELTGEEA